jgi:hypothetical protein
MRINDLFRGFLSAPSNSQPTTPAAEAPVKAAPPAASLSVAAPSAASQPASQKFRDILAEYDVQRISPREFSAMLQKLHAAGQIGDRDFQQLADLRANLDGAHVDPDEPVDLLAFLQDRLDQRELTPLNPDAVGIDGEPSGQADPQAPLRQLEWLQKFALVHTGADAEAFDATA